MLTDLPDRLQLARESVAEQVARWGLLINIGYRSVTIADLDFDHHTEGISAGSTLLFRDKDKTLDSLANTAFQEGFTWNSEDQDQAWWRPQGITGTADASASNEWEGERYLIVSWHSLFEERDREFEGAPDAIRQGTGLARITVVKVTNGFDEAPYRHVLLVEPYEKRTGRTGFSVIASHAGGIVWHGRYLFVASAKKLLIFDLTTILDLDDRIDDSASSHGTPVLTPSRVELSSIPSAGASAAYDDETERFDTMGCRYVCPLYMKYTLVESDEFGSSHFATLGLDRSFDPPRLVSSQFVDVGSEDFDQDVDHAVVSWWKLHEATGLLDNPTADTITCARLVATGEEFIQGVHAWGSQVWLSTAIDLLHRVVGGSVEDADYNWPHGAESLHYSPSSDHLWCLNEFEGFRAVWCINRNDAWPFWWTH